jgi:carbonic anhydrase
MHAPAEHKFNGKQHDLEMHIVHELVDGPNHETYKEQLAVIGIILKKAPESHPFVKKLNTKDFGQIENINFNELFQDSEGKVVGEFYHYKGSLTTPPCTDIVNWNLYSRVLPINEQHLEELHSSWHDNLHGHCNFRECQPLYGRRVVKNFK